MHKYIFLKSPKFVTNAVISLRLTHNGLFGSAAEEVQRIFDDFMLSAQEDYLNRKGWKSTVLEEISPDLIGSITFPPAQRTSIIPIVSKTSTGRQPMVSQITVDLYMDPLDSERHSSYILKTITVSLHALIERLSNYDSI